MSRRCGLLVHDLARRRRASRPVRGGGVHRTPAGRAQVRHALAAARGLVVQRRPAGLIDDFDFLGQRVRGGISPGLRDRLRDVAVGLRSQYDALEPAARLMGSLVGGAPRSFEEWAGVTSVRSWRPEDTCPPDNCSFHQSGSAVDVNYDLQPYIATRTVVRGTTHFGGEAAGASLRAQRRAAVEVYDHAVQFVGGPAETADVGARRTGEATADVYQRFRKVSDALQQYFAFAFLPGHRAGTRRPVEDIEGASDADLLAAIPETERLPEATGVALLEAHMQTRQFRDGHPDWPRTPREQYFRILRDYEHVRIPMVRGRPVARPGDTRNPARGFLHMPPWLVEALVDAGRLRWGAADFGHRASGDVHHFDLGRHDLTPDGQP